MTMDRAIQLQQQAWALQADGKLAAARVACREALAIVEECAGGRSLDAANLLNDLADIEKDSSDFTAALAAAESALAIENSQTSVECSESAIRIRLKTLSVLGEIQRSLGDYSRAEEYLKEALVVAETKFGKHSEETALASNGLAVLYKYCGRFDEGIALYREALQYVSAISGQDSLDAGVILHNIGGILFSKGDFAAAEEPGRRAWEISRQRVGDDAIHTTTDAVAYAAILDGLGRYSECEVIYRRALVIYERELGAEHYEVAATLHNLGAALAAQAQYEQAERCYRRALTIKEKILGENNPDVALSAISLGSLLNATGRSEQAEPILRKAVAVLEEKLTPEHPQLTAAREHLKKARSTHQQRFPEAGRRDSTRLAHP